MADSTPIFLSLYSDKEISEKQYQQELIKEFGGRIDGFDPKKPLGKRALKKRIGHVYVKAFSKSRFVPNSDESKEKFIKQVLELSAIEKSTLSVICSSPSAARHRDPNTSQFALIVNACAKAISTVYKAVKPIDSTDWFLASQYTNEPLLIMTEYQRRCWVACALLNVITRKELSWREEVEATNQSERERTSIIAQIAIYATLLDEADLKHLLGNAIRGGHQFHYSDAMLYEDGARELRTYAEEQGYIEEDEDEPEDYISEEDFLKLLNLATKTQDLALTQHLFAAALGSLSLWPEYEL